MTPKPIAIIVEDDSSARQMLFDMITEDGRVQIKGQGRKIEDVLTLIREETPEIAFLDVELENRSVFEILDQLRNDYLPLIVFTTGYEKYALQAIKHAAFDYLLKPIIKEELASTIGNLINTIETKRFKHNIEVLLEQIRPPKKLKFNTRAGFIFIDPNEILYIHADWNYSEIYLSKDQNEVVSITIGKLSELLSPYGHFCRISRSLIVNSNYLKKVNSITRNCTLEKSGEKVHLKASLGNILNIKNI